MRKQIVTRIEKLRALAEEDSARRCEFCRRALPFGYLTCVVGLEMTRRYCNAECLASAKERAVFQRPI